MVRSQPISAWHVQNDNTFCNLIGSRTLYRDFDCVHTKENPNTSPKWLAIGAWGMSAIWCVMRTCRLLNRKIVCLLLLGYTEVLLCVLAQRQECLSDYVVKKDGLCVRAFWISDCGLVR